MNEITTEAEVWKEAIMIYMDNSYSRGETVDNITTDIKTIINATELGDVSFSIDQIVQEWKSDRGLV